MSLTATLSTLQLITALKRLREIPFVSSSSGIALFIPYSKSPNAVQKYFSASYWNFEFSTLSLHCDLYMIGFAWEWKRGGGELSFILVYGLFNGKMAQVHIDGISIEYLLGGVACLKLDVVCERVVARRES
jgi:hypothetical protein